MSTDSLAMINQRYLSGITDEPKQLLPPIQGYALEPLLSLEDACQPILNIVPHLPTHIWIAKENCKQPSDGLTQDESAAIHLYTMKWDANVYDTRESLYSHLNRTLRQNDRTKLRPWFCYLKLFLTALVKLPPLPRQTVWRGARKDFSADYPRDTRVTWWGFSSCTQSLDVLESQSYLGDTDTRTLFSIETFNARSIGAHSHFKGEDEILLFPGTYLEVISQFKPSPDLNIIHLRQMTPPHELLESPFAGAELLAKANSQIDIVCKAMNRGNHVCVLPFQRKQSRIFLLEETDDPDRFCFNSKTILIIVGLFALVILAAIVLGAVLGTQLRNNKSSVLYWASEPVVNLNPATLIGWNLCYSGDYHVLLHDILDDVLNHCNKTKLLLACRFIHGTNFAVAAMGQRSDVIYETPNLNDFHLANNITWYFDRNSSWGFARASDNVIRTPCDSTFGTGDDDSRLCWHTVDPLDGFRCGNAYFNSSKNYLPEQWLRFIYHAD